MDSLALARGTARRLRDRVTRARQDGGMRAATIVLARTLRQACMRAVVTTGDVIVDRRYGMRTAGVVRNERTLRDRSEHADSNHYQPISRRGFRQILLAADVDPGVASFVDLGAGRGRALVFAAEHGFRTVVGVELDPALAEQARSNLAGWQARRRRGAGPVVF